jgi:carbamoyl-phosphate synthase large subunit
MSQTILITGIGGDIAQSVAKILKSRWPQFRLLGTDTHQQHGGRLFVEGCFTLPMASDPSYANKLLHVLLSQNVDLLLPMTEPELGVLDELGGQVGPARCVTAGSAVIQAGIDKLATSEALSRFSLPAPWTFAVGSGEPLSYPCILKNRFGSGSRAVFVVEDPAEARCMAQKHTQAVYQELLEPADREVTCAVYRSREGKIASLQMMRKLAGGFTGWARVVEDAETSRVCEILASNLELRGSMNVQLRLTDRGPRVFEINPRFSSTALMRHYLGFTDVVWTFEEILGQRISFPKIATGQEVARVQDAIVMNKK